MDTAFETRAAKSDSGESGRGSSSLKDGRLRDISGLIGGRVLDDAPPRRCRCEDGGGEPHRRREVCKRQGGGRQPPSFFR